jgi:hypothetical protein
MKAWMLLLIAGLLACLALHAATEQWRYATGQRVAQILADGKGGCAVLYGDTNDHFTIVWLDKKGAVRYQQSGQLSSGPPLAMLAACTSKQLLHSDLSIFYQLVQVNKKGEPRAVAALGGFVLGSPLFPAPFALSDTGDRKGFFVLNTDTNTSEDTVVRYRFK